MRLWSSSWKLEVESSWELEVEAGRGALWGCSAISKLGILKTFGSENSHQSPKDFTINRICLLGSTYCWFSQAKGKGKSVDTVHSVERTAALCKGKYRFSWRYWSVKGKKSKRNKEEEKKRWYKNLELQLELKVPKFNSNKRDSAGFYWRHRIASIEVIWSQMNNKRKTNNSVIDRF